MGQGQLHIHYVFPSRILMDCTIKKSKKIKISLLVICLGTTTHIKVRLYNFDGINMRIFNKSKDTHRNTNHQKTIFIILLLAFLLRYMFIGERYFWGDESSSALISEKNLMTLLYQASHDVHPPLYYVLLHFWMNIFGGSMVAIRLMSVSFGIITVYVAIKVTKLISNNKSALISGWFMAILPIAIQYSQEARMYSLLCMLLLLATYFIIKWLKDSSDINNLILYVIFITLSFYTPYFTIFTFMTHWVFIVFLSKKTDLNTYFLKTKSWWIANFSITIFFLPGLIALINLLFHIEDLKVGNDIGWIPEVTHNDLPKIYIRFFGGNFDSIPLSNLTKWTPVLAMLFIFNQLLKLSIDRSFNFIFLLNLILPVIVVFLFH